MSALGGNKDSQGKEKAKSRRKEEKRKKASILSFYNGQFFTDFKNLARYILPGIVSVGGWIASPPASFGVCSSRIHFSPDEQTPKDVCGEACEWSSPANPKGSTLSSRVRIVVFVTEIL